MIDWLTLSGPWSGPVLDGGRVQRIGPDGEVESDAPRARRVEGSHDSAVRVRARGDGALWLDGNPAKFLTGQNVVGSDDLRALAAALFLAVCDRLELEPTRNDAELWGLGLVDVSRVDVTYSRRLRSRADVLATIRAIEAGSTLQFRGRGTLTGGSTVYFGKHSRRWSLKAYSKGQELAAGKGHGLAPALLASDPGQRLAEYADALLRLEVTFRALELKRLKLDRVRSWSPVGARKLHHSILRRLTMPKALPAGDDLAHLPARLRAIAAAHLAGVDTRTLVSTRTWYRHRKALQPFGIDLATNPPKAAEPRSNVVPFVRYVDITPAYNEPPADWMHRAGFIPEGLPASPDDGTAPLEYGRRWPDRFPEEAVAADLHDRRAANPDYPDDAS